MLSLILIPLLLILLLASLALTIIGFISKNKTSKTLFLVFGFSLLIGLVGIIFIFKSAETSNNTKYCGKYIDTIDNQTITLEIKQNDSFTLSSSNCKDTIKGTWELVLYDYYLLELKPTKSYKISCNIDNDLITPRGTFKIDTCSIEVKPKLKKQLTHR